jgi:hypothetical protein
MSARTLHVARGARVLGLAPLALLAACGSPGPAPLHSPTEFENARIEAECAAKVRCGDVAPEDLQLCEEHLQELATPPPYGDPQELFESYLIAFDGDAAARCIAGWATGRCGFTPADCKRVYHGLLPEGFPCQPTQCGPGLGCGIGGGCTGICQPLPTVHQGCSTDGCADGASCSQYNGPRSGMSCVAQLPEGGVCGEFAGAICPEDDFCSFDEGSNSGHCVPLSALPGLPAGACCNDYDSRCVDGWVCMKGVCGQHTPTGGACAVDAYGASTCFDLEFCVDGTCIPGGRIGDPCDDKRACVIGYCNAGQCVPKPLRGESCSITAPCSGLDYCEQAIPGGPGRTCIGAACVRIIGI